MRSIAENSRRISSLLLDYANFRSSIATPSTALSRVPLAYHACRFCATQHKPDTKIHITTHLSRSEPPSTCVPLSQLSPQSPPLQLNEHVIRPESERKLTSTAGKFHRPSASHGQCLTDGPKEETVRRFLSRLSGSPLKVYLFDTAALVIP